MTATVQARRAARRLEQPGVGQGDLSARPRGVSSSAVFNNRLVGGDPAAGRTSERDQLVEVRKLAELRRTLQHNLVACTENLAARLRELAGSTPAAELEREACVSSEKLARLVAYGRRHAGSIE